MKVITFIEKATWTAPSPFTGQTYAPVFMVKDGVEYFVVNRVVHSYERGYESYSLKQSQKGLEATKAFLIQNDGEYFKFNGIYVDPFEMLKEMEERGHTFCDPDKLFDDCRKNPGYGGGFVDFHGNRNEVAAAFHYRIYDESMLEKLRVSAAPIIEKSKKRR
ncbi:hypothetical protein AALA82_00910 [Oscillospiraceae bacterium 50-16]